MLQIVGFVASAVSLGIISITMLARANDLRWRKGLIWNARLLGFILAGVAPFGVIGWEVAMQEWPSLYEVVMRIGLMLVFITTPYLPPWWKWITDGSNNEPIIHTDDRRRGDRKVALDRRRDESP